MWLLVLLFGLATLILGWTLFCYFLWLCFQGLFRKQDIVSISGDMPFISIVVPCCNEEDAILRKLTNLRALDYPESRMEIIFADGGSTDETVAKLRNALNKHEAHIKLVECQGRGKIAQLNEMLPLLAGEIVINTDVDAYLSASCIREIVSEFAVSSDVWVVGAYCKPADSIEIEHYYWDAQNRGRYLENDAWSSSIVIALCYAFRKELLSSFPEDVVADDIYIAFLANTLGYRVVYSRKAVAEEMRSPTSYSEFLPHKFRKSNAFLRESLRFLYRLPEMKLPFKIMLLTRIGQQLLLPWIMLIWLLLAGVLITLFRFDVLLFAVLFLMILFAMTIRVFAWVRLPCENQKYSFFVTLKGYVLTNMIMLATAVSYPFYQQNSSYARIGANPVGAGSGANRSAK